MVRVLLIDHVTAVSGAEVALARLVDALDKNRFELVAALPDSTGPLAEWLGRTPNVRIRVIPASRRLLGFKKRDGLSSLARTPGVAIAFVRHVVKHAHLIRDEQVDVVFTNTLKAHYYGTLAAILARRPVVWYMHDLVDRSHFPAWVRTSLTRLANWRAARVLCNSEATKRALADAGVRSDKLLTVYCAPPRLATPSDRETVVREFGLAADDRLVTMVGRLTPQKGQREFVQAAARLLASGRKCTFLIVGDSVFGSYDDEYKAGLVEMIRRKGLETSIRLTGSRSDAAALMAASDVVVFHSMLPEGFGLAVAEAMLLGRPVISTVLGGTAELVQDGRSGIEVQPGDVDGLQHAMGRLLDDLPHARALGEAGKIRAEQLMSMEYVRRMESAIQTAAAR